MKMVDFNGWWIIWNEWIWYWLFLMEDEWMNFTHWIIDGSKRMDNDRF